MHDNICYNNYSFYFIGGFLLKLYIDESGSITRSTLEKNRYFVISYIETAEPEKVSRVFRKFKVNYIKHTPNSGFSVGEEIKGSAMPNDMKTMLFNELKKKTDIKVHYIIFDNRNAEMRLRNKPSIAFNYLMSLKLNSIFYGKTKINNLWLKLDNRNCAVYGLNSLQEYLEIEFCIKKRKCDNIEVKYHESDKKELIQIADIFSNTLFKMCKYHGKENVNLIRHYANNKAICDILEPGHKEYFPRTKCDLSFIN